MIASLSQPEIAREPLLEVRGLTKSFDGVLAVDAVDIDLAPDEVLALVGPSGCGKSTLLRMIAGLVAADAGTIRLGGVVVEGGRTRLPPERRSAGLVFQEHALFPHLTVEENVAFGIRGTDGRARAAIVADMLAMADLKGYGDRYPHELSGGERQRVALARALAPKPQVMLFDEPFASLDHNLRVQLRQDVLAMLRKMGTPAIIVTHDQREALSIGDRIAVMHEGRLVQQGRAASVFHEPASIFVAGFMGVASFLRIEEGSTGAATALGPVTLAGRSARECAAMVRPDDVQFEAVPGGTATVVGSEYHGTQWLVVVEAATGERVTLMRSHLEPLAIGERGEMALSPGHRQVVVDKSADAS